MRQISCDFHVADDVVYTRRRDCALLATSIAYSLNGLRIGIESEW